MWYRSTWKIKSSIESHVFAGESLKASDGYTDSHCLHYLLSLVGILSRYFFVLTNFDSLRRHTHATTHALGKQEIRAKMMSLDSLFFCRGNKWSFCSLAGFYRRKHK